MRAAQWADNSVGWRVVPWADLLVGLWAVSMGEKMADKLVEWMVAPLAATMVGKKVD